MANPNIYSILSQTKPATTGATTAFTAPANNTPTIVGIAVCNLTNSNVTYSIYISPTTNTYNTTTAIVFNYELLANDSDFIEFPFTLLTTGGSVGVQSNTDNAINFTIIGQVNFA